MSKRIKVHATKAPRTRPTRPLLVYYKECGTERVCSAHVQRREGEVIRFTDGGWNAAEHTFLTPGQAAAYQCDCVSCRASKSERNEPDPEVEIVRCRYCGTTNVIIGGYGQCIKGCPGYFDIIATVRVPRKGMEAVLQAKKER